MQKILIADRDLATREWYADLVRAMGHIPLVCENAIEVLDCATTNPDLHLILMAITITI